jgi:hypothetical protein
VQELGGVSAKDIYPQILNKGLGIIRLEGALESAKVIANPCFFYSNQTHTRPRPHKANHDKSQTLGY